MTTTPQYTSAFLRRLLNISAPLAALSGCLFSSVAQAAPNYTMRVLANDLANPRGLLVQGDQVFVSEAGAGGPALPGNTNCFVSGAMATLCSGNTGSLGAWNITSQSYRRLITGLPSLAQANGTEGTGLADLASGGPTGLLGVFGFGGNPVFNVPANLGSNLFGQLVSVSLTAGPSQVQPIANLSQYEQINNPDGGDVASNPYAVQVHNGKVYATDSGANTLLTLSLTPNPLDGTLPIEGHFAFPTISVTPPPFLIPPLSDPHDAGAVPTGLAVNPISNKLLIGEFAGFPFVPGSASVYATDGLTSPAVELMNFTSITDVAADAMGNTYILEYTANWFGPSATGSIWQVTASGSRQRIIDGLVQPTGLAVGADQTIYVTNRADGLQGQLLEYRPVPGPLPLAGAGALWCQTRRLRQRLCHPARGVS